MQNEEFLTKDGNNKKTIHTVWIVFCCSRFRPIKSNLTKITALLKAGFSEMDILEVIQLKTIQWKNNPKMAGYLCPTTLFRESNFEKYHNEVNQVKANPKLYEQYFRQINKVAQSAAVILL